MTAPSADVVIPTAGRDSLARLLDDFLDVMANR